MKKQEIQFENFKEFKEDLEDGSKKFYLIKYEYPERDINGNLRYLESMSPGNYYIATIEGDKYELYTRNVFTRMASNRIKVLNNKRFIKIGVITGFASNSIDHIFVEKQLGHLCKFNIKTHQIDGYHYDLETSLSDCVLGNKKSNEFDLVVGSPSTGKSLWPDTLDFNKIKDVSIRFLPQEGFDIKKYYILPNINLDNNNDVPGMEIFNEKDFNLKSQEIKINKDELFKTKFF